MLLFQLVVYMWIYTFPICYKDIHFEYHSLYGAADKSILHNVVPFIITTLLFLVVILFCRIILRKFRGITAIDALQSRDKIGKERLETLFHSIDLNLKCKYIYWYTRCYKRFKLYRVLSIVLIIAVFMIVVPVNFCIRFSHRSLLIIWEQEKVIFE